METCALCYECCAVFFLCLCELNELKLRTNINISMAQHTVVRVMNCLMRCCFSPKWFLIDEAFSVWKSQVETPRFSFQLLFAVHIILNFNLCKWMKMFKQFENVNTKVNSNEILGVLIGFKTNFNFAFDGDGTYLMQTLYYRHSQITKHTYAFDRPVWFHT